MVFIWTLMGLAAGFEIGKGIVRVDETNFPLFSEGTTLNLTDSRLSIGFTLIDNAETDNFVLPELVSVALSSSGASFKQFLPTTIIQDKVFEAAVPISGISPWLLSQDSISIEIITGDHSNENWNAKFPTGSIAISSKLQNSINLPEQDKHEPKREITHVFRVPPKSVISILISQFIFEISVSLAVLIGAWLYFDAWNVESAKNVSLFTYPFIISLFTFQYIIFDYYKQASIFDTIARVAMVTPVAVYCGIKSLRSIYKLQTAGTH